ncbi:MAG: RNA polymerase sigma factor [Sphingobacteriia bacterium]|nr:RNA polymerase sigma factor [Sphingobacteriia bacterium]
MTIDEYTNKLWPIRDRIFRLARRLLVNDEDAQDIVQDTYLKLWSSKMRLEEVSNMEAMAMTVTRNLCLDKLKSHSHKYTVYENSFSDSSAASATADNQVHLKDLQKNISQLISQLPEQQRTVMHLRDVEGLEFDQISYISGQSINAVRANLSRARKKVRETLEKIYEHEHSIY